MKKSLLLIVGTLNMGGIETYTMRLAKSLSKHIQVKILILSNKYNKELLIEVSKYATVYFLHKYTTPNLLKNNSFVNRIPFLVPLNYKKLLLDLSEITYIHATNSESLIIANNLTKYDKKIKYSVGVYHSKEFTWNSNFYFRSIEKNIFLSMHNKNILSPNESSSIVLESHYKKKFELPIIPIGIEMSSQLQHIFNPNSNKIISIGRLVEFKIYNEHIINILDEINDINNTAYEYHIYGYGPNEEKLKAIALTKKSKIVFHGIIEYSKIKDVLSDCILFIGSGTAIIEASSLGIPSIIGIESNKNSETYGFFADLVGFSYNEDNLDIAKIKIIQVINEFLELNTVQKKQISHKHIKKAQQFSMSTTSKLFLDALENLHSNQYYLYKIIKYKISYLVWFVLNKLNILHEMKNRYDT